MRGGRGRGGEGYAPYMPGEMLAPGEDHATLAIPPAGKGLCGGGAVAFCGVGIRAGGAAGVGEGIGDGGVLGVGCAGSGGSGRCGMGGGGWVGVP